MKPGFKSTEFYVLIAIIAFAFLLATGILKPYQMQQAAEQVQEGANVLPSIANAIKAIVERCGELLIAAGLALAYIRRRASAKQEIIKTQAAIELEKAKKKRIEIDDCK